MGPVKNRHNYTSLQVTVLERYLQAKPKKKQRKEIAKELKLTDGQIKAWFRNRYTQLRRLDKRNFLKSKEMGYDDLKNGTIISKVAIRQPSTQQESFEQSTIHQVGTKQSEIHQQGIEQSAIKRGQHKSHQIVKQHIPTLHDEFTDFQLITLENEFRTCKYVNKQRLNRISVNLGLPENQVNVWFQNRLSKDNYIAKNNMMGHSSYYVDYQHKSIMYSQKKSTPLAQLQMAFRQQLPLISEYQPLISNMAQPNWSPLLKEPKAIPLTNAPSKLCGEYGTLPPPPNCLTHLVKYPEDPHSMLFLNNVENIPPFEETKAFTLSEHSKSFLDSVSSSLPSCLA